VQALWLGSVVDGQFTDAGQQRAQRHLHERSTATRLPGTFFNDMNLPGVQHLIGLVDAGRPAQRQVHADGKPDQRWDEKNV
jgi:hypothetical protein